MQLQRIWARSCNMTSPRGCKFSKPGGGQEALTDCFGAEDVKRKQELAEQKAKKQQRRQQKAAAATAATFKSTSSSAAPGTASKPTPAGPIAFLFPGQGSQALGMLKDAKNYPAVVEMLSTAKAVLGYDLLDLCVNGPKEKLDDTAFAQPALYVAGLAAVEKLREENPAAAVECSMCAGLSLGEYCALTFAGVISFEDGLKAVKVRGEAMTAAAKMGKPHGMLSIIGLEDQALEEMCAKARTKIGGDAVCQLANYLFPTGRVVSGHKDALNEVQVLATAAGALKCAPLEVSGAFHTRLMEPARDQLIKVLKDVKFNEPRIPILSNVTAQPFAAADSIPGMLARQLVEPVRWEDILQSLVRMGKKELFECGPGSQIKAMVKRVDGAAWKAMKNASV